MRQKCDIGGQNSNYDYTNAPQCNLRCGNIVISEFSKLFLSHMYHVFLKKDKVTCSAILQYKQCLYILIIKKILENE